MGNCSSMYINSRRCNSSLHFSFIVSGGLTAPAEPYIKVVCRIAMKDFGDRVHFWQEMIEGSSDMYDWQLVNDVGGAPSFGETEE